MKFIDLLNDSIWEEVESSFQQFYPDEAHNIKGYEEAYRELRYQTPVYSSNMVIHIETVDDEEYGSYKNVYTTNGDGLNYGIDFVEWSEVLAMEIEQLTFANYSELEILAHMMYEITWNGFSNKHVQEKEAAIFGIIEEELNL